MFYGVKVLHTHVIGEEKRYLYEELVLCVRADSPDEAYDKAALYMRDCVCDYTNIYGECVKTHRIEAIDCFIIYEEEGDVQEVYSSFTRNDTGWSEDEYYRVITAACNEEELRPLRNIEFN